LPIFRLPAREREPDHAQHDLVALARDARLVALEHPLDRFELLPDPLLGLETLNQRDPLLRYAAEPLVELADLLLELGDARAARFEVELGLELLLAQILDVSDEGIRDRFDASIEIRRHVGGRGDLDQRFLVREDHVLELPALVPHRADALCEMDRVAGFVVRLLREAPRQVGVVAVLVQLALRALEELASTGERLRRIALHARLLRLREQRARDR